MEESNELEGEWLTVSDMKALNYSEPLGFKGFRIFRAAAAIS